ncbi:hypothetical protein GIB67_006558 [Kingdonia uniflora]|uniref:HAT C-terminal dimerisation domain-containing protein n=1 Tax=Kingdonia uniflora TaxID=39325 RepID=A0A7J7LEQ6_9MAGN|nr:hypothetical protein GIB67_006558 [Kingdonia uniflora]
MRQNKRSRRQLRDWEPQESSHDDSDEVEDITDCFGDASEPDYHPEEGSGGESQPTRTRSTGLLTHVIDLVLEDLESFSWLKDTIGDAKKISKFIYAHSWVLAKFRGHSNHRDLICPSLTRFATSFIAIRSIMKNKVHLQQLFVDTEYRESSYAKLSTSKAVQKIVMSDNFWKKTRSVVAMVEPLLKVLRLVNSDKPTMGWKEQLHSDLHAPGYILNPYYMFFPSIFSNENVMCHPTLALNNLIAKRISAPLEQTQVMLEIGKLPFKPGCMGSEAACITAQQGSPIDWWNSYGVELPQLQKLALERRREDRRRRYRVDPISVSAILLEDPLCEWIAGDDDESLLPIHEEWPEELDRELSAEDPEVNEQRRYSTSVIDTDFPENWLQAPMYQTPIESLPEAYFDFDFKQINLEHGQPSNYSKFDTNQFDSVYQ